MIKAIGIFSFIKINLLAFIIGLIFLIIVVPLILRVDGYFESNKDRKRIVLCVYIGIVVGVLTGLVFLVAYDGALLSHLKHEEGSTLILFGSSGGVLGFVISKAIKIKSSRYDISHL